MVHVLLKYRYRKEERVVFLLAISLLSPTRVYRTFALSDPSIQKPVNRRLTNKLSESLKVPLVDGRVKNVPRNAVAL